MSFIELQNIAKAFDGVPVLRSVSLTVERGELLLLMGRSGEGKSVTLKHIAGLLLPDHGSVRVDGKDLSSLSRRELRQVRMRLGFVFQGGALFDSLTIFDNVAFPLREKLKLSEREVKARVLEQLSLVSLTGAEQKLPSQLSGGMLKRAALARTLVMEPELVLFDEPTTGLDPIIARSILKLIRDCQQRLGFAGIMITHHIQESLAIATRAAILHEGRILITGKPEELRRSDEPFVRELLDGQVTQITAEAVATYSTE